MRRVGRNREKHRRAPVGWDVKPSGIYFRPTNAGDRAIVKAITGGPLSMPLGATHDEAAETFARLIITARRRQDAVQPGTCGEIFHRARLDLLPSIKSEKTREERARHIDALDKAFGSRRYARNVYEASRDTRGEFLRAMDAQRRLIEARPTRPVAANREARTGEIVFQWARAPWGLTEYNPFAGLMMNPEVPRLTVPADAAIAKLYRKLEPPARFLVYMIRYYGRRKVELLRLRLDDARGDGLHLVRGKREKAIVLQWEPRLRRAWTRLLRWRDRVKRAGKVEELHAAILNRHGRRYTVTAFNSARRRAMERAGLAVLVGERDVGGRKLKVWERAFTFHDVRKTRADTLPSLDVAAHVLAHDDKRTTASTYRVGPHIIDMTAEVNSRKKSGNSRKE